MSRTRNLGMILESWSWEQTDHTSIKFLRNYILKETANLDLKSTLLFKI